MTKEDFINWLARPITDSDIKMIDILLEMLDSYDKNVKIIEDLTLKVSKLQKEKLNSLYGKNVTKAIRENVIPEQIEILEV